jgi:hypothetical protein
MNSIKLYYLASKYYSRRDLMLNDRSLQVSRSLLMLYY